MNAIEIAKSLAERGLIDDELVIETAKAILPYLQRKGKDAVLERLSRMTYKTSDPKWLMPALLGRLPDLPQYQYKAELEAEERDYQSNMEFFAMIAEWGYKRTFQMPPLGKHIWHEAYRNNTWLSIRNEAQAQGVSMHEICRRKGLDYGSLII